MNFGRRGFRGTLVAGIAGLLLVACPVSSPSAWAAEEYLQIQFIKAVLLPRPVSDWPKLMEQNRDLLDASFFERCDQRIRWGLDNNQIDDAIRFSMIADEAMRANGQEGKYSLSLVYAFLKSGNEQMAEQLLTFLRLRDPKNPEVRFLTFHIWRGQSNFHDAYNGYKMLAQEGYRSDECYYQMGFISALLDQGPRAEKELGECLAINPNHKEAQSLLDKLVKSRPTFVPTGSNAGFKDVPVVGNTTTSVAANAENQKLADSLFRQAEAHVQTNQLPKAKDEYLRALQANPGLTKANVYLGALLYRMGDLDGAVRYLTVGVEQNPKDHDAWRFLAYAYERRFDSKKDATDLQKAIAAFERGASVFPEDRQFKVELQRVRAKANGK